LKTTKSTPESKRKREIRRREFYQALDSDSLSLKQAVRDFRKVLGMTQREFAKHVGVSPRIIMAFEQGTGNPTLATLAKILKGSGLELRLRRKRPRTK
jgi:DNA-binding XRE family transcriptional regulator